MHHISNPNPSLRPLATFSQTNGDPVAPCTWTSVAPMARTWENTNLLGPSAMLDAEGTRAVQEKMLSFESMHASSEMIRDDASDGEEPETTAWGGRIVVDKRNQGRVP